MEITSLPQDVLIDILVRLPVKPLIRFSLSSKQFLSLIHHPHFINRHLTRLKSNPSPDDRFLLLCSLSSEDAEKWVWSASLVTGGGQILTEHKKFQVPFKSRLGDSGLVRIVGSSNGLACLIDTTPTSHPGDIILWNMIIGKYKKLPAVSNFTHVCRDSKSHMVVGFGFVSKTNDFKVVKILYDGEGDVCPEVWVYAMEFDTWRKIEAIPPCSISMLLFDHMYVYVNGAVHWLVHKRPRSSDARATNSILSFDMGGEVFKELGLPNHLSANMSHLLASASGETLSLFLKFDPRAHVEVWLMQEYGVVDSWTRQFSIASEQILTPLKFMDNRDVLLRGMGGNLVSYDAENKQMNDLEISQMNDLGISDFKICLLVRTWTSSLILLDSGEKVLG